MKDLLVYIVTKIVDHPDDVSVKEEKNEQFYTTNLFLQTNKEDMGKVIGKNGKIIKAIRHLVRLPAITQDRRVNIELVEPLSG
jgi:predicted RNA-binding protein YlqC (UPF0109 family)